MNMDILSIRIMKCAEYLANISTEYIKHYKNVHVIISILSIFPQSDRQHWYLFQYVLSVEVGVGSQSL